MDRPGSRRPLEDILPLLVEVEGALDEELPLAELARRAGRSPFHFHRAFTGAVGEPVARHLARRRLERAALLVAVSEQRFVDIALEVGFQRPETFSRAFRRAFGRSPRDYRQAARRAQAERLVRNLGFRGDGCVFSEVWFTTLPAMSLLAIRHLGPYDVQPTPLSSEDRLWTTLVSEAAAAGLDFSPEPIGMSLDDPTMTPGPLQRLDACIALRGEGAATPSARLLVFAGGPYAAIEHVGPKTTLLQAYRALADGVRRSGRWTFGDWPPVQILRERAVGGDPSMDRNEVYFPLRRRPGGKKRQDRAGAGG